MKIQIIVREIFYFFSTLIVVSLIMELAWPRIILAYFDLNWLILAWVIVTIMMVYWQKKDQ